MSLEQVIEEINKIIPGWVQYFKLAKAEFVLERIDGWTRRKLRCFRLKQFKRPYTITKNLENMGIKASSAWRIALSGKGWWSLSKTPQLDRAMNIAWFDEQGLYSLRKTYKRVAL